MLIFGVLDKKGNYFFPPMFVSNKVEAMRGVEQAVNTAGNLLNRYPYDFALYELGEFDEKTGRFTSLDIPRLEVEASVFIVPVKTGRGNEVTPPVLQDSERSEDKKGEL